MKRLLPLLLALAGAPAFAVNGFSRSCGFDEIGVIGGRPMQAALLKLVYLVGDGAWGAFDSYLNASPAVQARLRANESITASYGDGRFYLYAESRAYRHVTVRVPGGTSEQWAQASRYVSKFYSQQLPREILDSPEMGPLFRNRGGVILANARAGHPAIFEATDASYVVGQHAYYDSSARTVVQFGRSYAYTCNLSDWGFEWLSNGK